jgi:hypothetical protein
MQCLLRPGSRLACDRSLFRGISYSDFRYLEMAKTNSQAAKARSRKSKRGRPRTTGPGSQIQVRCHSQFLSRVDAWRAKQEGDVSRPDAIRRLAEIGLEGS